MCVSNCTTLYKQSGCSGFPPRSRASASFLGVLRAHTLVVQVGVCAWLPSVGGLAVWGKASMLFLWARDSRLLAAVLPGRCVRLRHAVSSSFVLAPHKGSPIAAQF